MSTDPESHSSMSSRSGAWYHGRALWAGVSITIMWLAVLFVGVLGENIVSSTPGGTSTSVPVVVALLPFVLPATIVVARRGFKEVPERRTHPLDEASDVAQRLRPTRKAG